MEFPTIINCNSSICVFVVVFIFIQILKEHSASKQWRSLSDAAFCSDWTGSALLPLSGKKDARLIWVYYLSTV